MSKKKASKKLTRTFNFDVDDLINADEEFLPKGKFTATIDYPMSVEHTFTVEGPLSTIELAIRVAKEYNKVYCEPDKYGIWGHCIEDLVLEGMDIDLKKKTIEIFVGS